MIDLVSIKIIAGDGGNGAVSFYKLKNMRYGKPDGGDGGNGGSVYLEADPAFFDLETYRGLSTWKATSGENGGKNQKRGKDGRDIVLRVPIGTMVKLKTIPQVQNSLTKKSTTKSEVAPEMIFDLTEAGQKILAVRGGNGGRGNVHARGIKDRKGERPNHWDAFNRAQKGRWGEDAEVVLELKYLAQVGLIGLPNAGKSSLLSVLTNAKPQIADYPFTTLTPNIGVLETKGKTRNEKIIIADIPGLIEGASKGRGLGDKFLRHIERTGLLVHVLDVSAVDVKKDYETVRNELKLYGGDLDRKKEIIVFNKIDLTTEKKTAELKKLFGKKKITVVSAKTGEGLGELIKGVEKGL